MYPTMGRSGSVLYWNGSGGPTWMPSNSATSSCFAITANNLILPFAINLTDSEFTFFSNKNITSLTRNDKNIDFFLEDDLSTVRPSLDSRLNIDNATALIVALDPVRNWLEFVNYRQSTEINSYSTFLYDESFNISDKTRFLAEICARNFPIINKKVEIPENVKELNTIGCQLEESQILTGLLPVLHMSSLLFSDYLTLEQKKLFEKIHRHDLSILLSSEVWLFDKSVLPRLSNCCVKEYSYLTLKNNLTYALVKKIFNTCDPDIAGCISFLNQITDNSITKITFIATKLVEQLALDQAIKSPEAAALSCLFNIIASNIV